VTTLRATRTAAFFALSLASASVRVRADPAGRLAYKRGPGAEACPDEAALRRAVAARLGEDPFAPESSRTFRLSIATLGDHLRGSVEVLTDGVAEGRRELDVEPDRCPELVEAMALAVSLTINPNLVVTAPPVAATTDAAPPAVATPPRSSAPAPVAPVAPFGTGPVRDSAPAPASTTRAEAKPMTLAAGLIAHGAVGTGPGPAVGGSALVRVHGTVWELGLEGRLDALSRDDIGQSGTVKSSLLAGVLAPCIRHTPAHRAGIFEHFSGCGLLLVGSIAAGSEGVSVEGADRGIYVAAGGRIAASASLTDGLLLEARVDALYPLVPVTIVLDGAPVWRAGASGTLGAGVVGEIP